MPTATTIQNGRQPVPPSLAIESFIGAQIRAGRERRQMSLSALALKAQIPQEQLRAYEAGTMRIPAPALLTIVEALDMTLSDVFAL